MIFDDAFRLLAIGTKVRVSDGTPEPIGGDHHKHWHSRNFEGVPGCDETTALNITHDNTPLCN